MPEKKKIYRRINLNNQNHSDSPLFSSPELDELHTIILTLSTDELLLAMRLCEDSLWDQGCTPPSTMIDYNDIINYYQNR